MNARLNCFVIAQVLLRNGKLKLYGSQVGRDPDRRVLLGPLEDPDNVDVRRARMGLQPLADHLLNWNMKWTWKPLQHSSQNWSANTK